MVLWFYKCNQLSQEIHIIQANRKFPLFGDLVIFSLYFLFMLTVILYFSFLISAGTLAMGKLHKDIAMFMVKCVEEENNSDQKIIKVCWLG